MKKGLPVLLLLLLVCFYPTLLLAQTPFEFMDRDEDGRLSSSEFRGPPRAFRRIDRDGDGYIIRQEAAGTRLLRGADRKRQMESRSPAGKSRELIYIDTHNHLVGPRAGGEFNFQKSVRNALEAMDAAQVKLSLLMPMPQAAGQNLQLRFEDLRPIAKKYPQRFALLGGGGSLNTVIQQAVKEGRVTAAMEKEFDARALELVRSGVVGFGEMTAEHFSMSEDHPYETAPPDHPLFLRLADLAATHDTPIDLHMEAIPEEMPLPSRFHSPPNPRVLPPNIAAFRRLLAHNRRAKIIWVHLGWDNTEKRTAALTRELLRENPNLYASIRIASGMQKRKVVRAGFPLDKSGRLKDDWLALFQEFPDRFLIGSDEIIKPANNHPSAGSISSTVSMLEQLPENLKSKIGYENAYRLYKLRR